MKNFSSLESYLESRGCAFERDAGAKAIHFDMEGENARWRCVACQPDALNWALVSRLPLRAAAARRGACAELCTRINWNLAVGHFDLNFSDGELRFTTLIPVVEQDRRSAETLRWLFSAHRVLMDRFVPLFARVLFAGEEPSDALADEPGDNDEHNPLPRFSLN